MVPMRADVVEKLSGRLSRVALGCRLAPRVVIGRTAQIGAPDARPIPVCACRRLLARNPVQHRDDLSLAEAAPSLTASSAAHVAPSVPQHLTSLPANRGAVDQPCQE